LPGEALTRELEKKTKGEEQGVRSCHSGDVGLGEKHHLRGPKATGEWGGS